MNIRLFEHILSQLTQTIRQLQSPPPQSKESKLYCPVTRKPQQPLPKDRKKHRTF